MHTMHRSSSLSLNSYTKGMSGILRYSAMLVEGRVENMRDGRVYQALTFLPRTQLVRLSMVCRWSVYQSVHVYTTWLQTYVGGLISFRARHASNKHYIHAQLSFFLRTSMWYFPSLAKFYMVQTVPLFQSAGVCVCVCVCVWVFSRMTCMYAYIHSCIQIYVYAFIYACIHMYILTSIHTYVHTYIHTNIQTNI